ncbi:endonuclease-reverse transcriptase [Elysia marginata]|uniref:Endonuclease-reverse transcriptase n=1 Tax=Elysia marginata TaxID=1093978 RepID=A0AAV4HPH6_9GAST|nr:endonuclease-reverse transcriptase [Elysia marginata]
MRAEPVEVVCPASIKPYRLDHYPVIHNSHQDFLDVDPVVQRWRVAVVTGTGPFEILGKIVVAILIIVSFNCRKNYYLSRVAWRYADDTVLLAESENDLQNLVTIIEEKSEQYGLMMNTMKTKVMVISKTEPPKVNIKVKGKCIEQIEQFKYLGQLITTDARSDDEKKSRITVTKSAFTKLSHILVKQESGSTY